MKHMIFSIVVASMMLAGTCGAESVTLDPDGAYVIRIERPFTNNTPSWLPLRMAVQFKNAAGVRGGAFSIQHNNCWHPVDASKLRMADGKITGELEVAFRRDAGQRASASKAKTDVRDARRQTIRVDIPIGTGLSGAAPGIPRSGMTLWVCARIE